MSPKTRQASATATSPPQSIQAQAIVDRQVPAAGPSSSGGRIELALDFIAPSRYRVGHRSSRCRLPMFSRRPAWLSTRAQNFASLRSSDGPAKALYIRGRGGGEAAAELSVGPASWLLRSIRRNRPDTGSRSSRSLLKKPILRLRDRVTSIDRARFASVSQTRHRFRVTPSGASATHCAYGKNWPAGNSPQAACR